MQVHIADDELFAPICRADDQHVEWYDTVKGWQKELLPDFLAHWTGIALLIEPTDESGEKQYAQSRQREIGQQSRVPLMIAGLVFCLALFVSSVWEMASGRVLALLAIKCLGVVVSGLLIAYDLGANNPALQKLCSFGKKTNCQSILQTSTAKIYGDFGWADVGILYFSGGFLTVAGTLLTKGTGTLPWLMVLTILSLPYTVWSVYYQSVVARQYCTLCLTVQAIIWTELAVGYSFLTSDSLSGATVFSMLGTFVAVSVVWAYIHEPIRDARQLYPLRRELQTVKFSEAYLQVALTKQPRQLPYLNGQKPITLGNPDAENMLTVITNPACEACRIVHQELGALLERMSDLCIEIVLVASTQPEDRAGQVAQHLLGLPANLVEKAMRHWFDNPHQSVTRWVRNVCGRLINEQTRHQLAMNDYWHTRTGLQYTPIIYFNGVLLPANYRVTDLPHLYGMWSAEPLAQPKMDSVESV